MEAYREKVRHLIREAEYGEAFREIRKELESAKRDQNPQKKAWSLYFACISLFGLGHIQQARRYYQELLETTGDSVSSRYIQAYLELQSRKPEEALVTLTSILELDPSDTRCDGLIEHLKEKPEDFAEYSRKRAGILDFFPGIAPEKKKKKRAHNQNSDAYYESDEDPYYGDAGADYDDDSLLENAKSRLSPIGMKQRNFSDPEDSAGDSYGGRRKRILWIAGVTASLLVAAVTGWYGYQKAGQDPLMDSDLPRPPGHSTVLPEQAGEFRFFYDSKDKAVEDYEKARLAVEEGRINQARKILGRLERSNIDFVFKERARTLRQSIPLPRMQDFQDSVTLAEVESDPFSYRDAVFLWDVAVEKALPSGTGTDLRVRLPDRKDSLLLRYSGQSKELQNTLKELETGQEITVYGRILSSDDQGANMNFQLLDLTGR